MNFVKADRIVEDAAGVAALREEHAQFCAEVADGLHALAQPLTIVRSAIAMLATAKDGGTGCERYVDLSARQIERTCQLFSSVQSLLATRMPAEQEAIDCESLLSRIFEDRSHSLDALGIRLVQALPEAAGTIVGDRQRTGQALSAAIDTAISVSSAGDVIQVDSSISDGCFEFAVQSTCRQENDLKSADRLNLSLAKANILSQRGRYHFTLDPFRILLALPVQQPNIENSETVPCEACTV
ncbi:MAG: hypothetical protein WBE38_20230 [Terracidiphilus sp.]|jgi:signal transduction histidine kinase